VGLNLQILHFLKGEFMHLVPSKFRHKTPVSYNPRVGTDLGTLQREMNSLMNNFFDWGGTSWPANFSDSLYPTLDIREEDNKYFVDADVPGMTDKDINLDIRNNVLTISGKLDSEVKNDDKGYVCVERTHEAFSRDVHFADDIDMDSVKAELKNGVLHLEISKSESSKKKHKKIAIKH
jgi:HSP20 family protein